MAKKQKIQLFEQDKNEHSKIMQNNFSWPFLVDHIEHYAYVKDVFSREETDKIIAHGKEFQSTLGKVERVKNPNNVFISPFGIEWAYQKLTTVSMGINEGYFKFDLFGFMEGLQFTEYRSNCPHYSWHQDRMYSGLVRKLSVVLQLTDEDEYEGGDLEIMTIPGGEPHRPPRERGSVIVFPSYEFNQITPVTKGTRYSLVGWVTGKPFK